MAMFCLLLAAAAFVLTGGPRGCRCDRPERGHEWYRAANDGFDGAVWRQDESNSIPVTKLTLARSRYYPAAAAAIAFRASSTPPELLLNRYRKYMVDTFVRFDDACSSYDDNEEDDSHNSDGPGGPSTVRSDVSERSPTPPDDAGTRETAAGDEKRSNTPWAETMKLPVDGEWCSKSAKNFYRCLRDRLDDQQLVAAIDNYIEANCYRSETDADDGGGPGNSFPEKRDWPKYVSKQKFHSWGGKRNAGQVFYPWGGKRTAVPRAHKQPKVVIRNPFHSWGGKRSDLAVAVMA